MKNCFLLLNLFFTCVVQGQVMRLDSLVHHSPPSLHDYINTYAYITDRDFTIHHKELRGGNGTAWSTLTYRDSLLVYCILEFPKGDNIVNEYKYDGLRRKVFSSVRFSNSGSMQTKQSYWKETNLITLEETVSLIRNDTETYEIKHFTYDDQNRKRTSDSMKKDIQGKIHRYTAVIEYMGDSVVVEKMKIFNEGSGWTNSVTQTRYYPEIHYGDTICTTYCQSDLHPEMENEKSSCCTKYEWGKRGTRADWGYIAYRNGNIYGEIADFSTTDHGYIWTGYECRSEKGPDNWKEDLKSRFQPTTTCCVSLNEYGLPVLDEAFYTDTGELWYRKEYYYKEADLHTGFGSRNPEPATCQIVHELNPFTTYYDILGRLVSEAGDSQFLLEAGPTGMKRVLFVRE